MLFALPACSEQESPPPVTQSALTPDQLQLVTNVIDGDTIKLENGIKVRYIGIDTPETKHPKKPVQYFGREASEANRKLVEGKKVRLEYDVQKIDKYGRTLAYVYLNDGTFVNAWLVENGYACVSTYPPNVKYQERFLELERKAREGKKGLWAQEEQKEVTVYVTNTGKKYHQVGCKYLAKSSIPMSLKEAKAKNNGPCSVCNPPK